MPNSMIWAEDSTSGKPIQIQGTSDALHIRTASSVYGNFPATWNLATTFTGTAAAVGTSSDLTGYGFPFKNIKFTKSAAAETISAVLCVSGLGKGMIYISGLTAETVSVTALIDGTQETTSILLKQSAGSATAAAAIGNGVYLVVTE